MAKPAFIYAFDNLGPERFVELCGYLLSSRYKGFLLGGIGADGGIDAEIDNVLGEWHPEEVFALLNEVIQPGQLVVFQFKHKVTARVGQAESRKQLMNLYKCSNARDCELHRDLILEKQPIGYVLVTNVEVNSQFRNTFIQQCRKENPNIEHYQVIGLDELEAWVSMASELRHLYFPTIFGLPRFDLRLQLSEGVIFPVYGRERIPDFDQSTENVQLSVLNVGTVPSYVSSIGIRAIVDGEAKTITMALSFASEKLRQINPQLGTAIEPGRKQTYIFPFESLQLRSHGKEIFPIEFVIWDEIGNMYSESISEELRNRLLGFLV